MSAGAFSTPFASTPAKGLSSARQTPVGVDDAFCPAGEAGAGAPADGPLFQIVPGFTHELGPRYERFLRDNGIEIAGIEFILDNTGRAFTYDINTNTNYNGEAEAVAGVSGMRAIASFLGRELEGAGTS